MPAHIKNVVILILFFSFFVRIAFVKKEILFTSDKVRFSSLNYEIGYP
jgi:hypothetical protein